MFCGPPDEGEAEAGGVAGCGPCRVRTAGPRRLADGLRVYGLLAAGLAAWLACQFAAFYALAALRPRAADL